MISGNNSGTVESLRSLVVKDERELGIYALCGVVGHKKRLPKKVERVVVGDAG